MVSLKEIFENLHVMLVLKEIADHKKRLKIFQHAMSQGALCVEDSSSQKRVNSLPTKLY